MANSLLNIFGNLMGGGSGGGGGNILTQILGAMIRGESPTDFAKRLAQTHPALRGLDLDNLDATAAQLCRERGIDQNKLTAEIKDSVAKMQK